jgi:hypothetical protein
MCEIRALVNAPRLVQMAASAAVTIPIGGLSIVFGVQVPPEAVAVNVQNEPGRIPR